MRDGIYIEFGNFCIINNNVSKNNLRYGLHFMFSNDNVYTNNMFNNNGAGVAVMFSKKIKMINNTFKKTGVQPLMVYCLKRLTMPKLKTIYLKITRLELTLMALTELIIPKTHFTTMVTQ